MAIFVCFGLGGDSSWNCGIASRLTTMDMPLCLCTFPCSHIPIEGLPWGKDVREALELNLHLLPPSSRPLTDPQAGQALKPVRWHCACSPNSGPMSVYSGGSSDRARLHVAGAVARIASATTAN